MLDLDHDVGGLTCRQVLEGLSDFVDGNLPEDVVEAVHSHLAECRNCEAFGGRFTGVLAALRATLEEAPAVEAQVFQRLNERLDKDLP